MECKLLIAGFGGQGVMLMGQLLGYAACEDGKNVTFLPSYGPEQRGGTANCTVIISDDEIGSPTAAKVDVLIAMNEPALQKFRGAVKPGGALLVNSSRAESKVERSDIRVFYLPIDDIAYSLGSAKVANIVMLGALANVARIFDVDRITAVVKAKLGKKPELMSLNKAALLRGIDLTN